MHLTPPRANAVAIELTPCDPIVSPPSILSQFDIAVNFRTGYVTGGHYMDDPYLAARHYLRGGFPVDFAGSFPFNLIESSASSGVAADAPGGSASRLNRLLRLLRLFKLARMFRLARYMKDLELLQHNPGLIRIGKLALIALLFCHILGCAWWLVADYERETPAVFGWDPEHVENRWIPEEHLINGTLGAKWAHSFYWGAGMVTSLVPKDVEPVTQLECAVTTVALFSGLILNAFVISALTSAMNSLDSAQAIASEKLEAVRNYLTFKGVGPELRARIIEFYEYLLTSSQSGEQERALLQDMPPNLSMQLAIAVNKRLIKPVPYFATFTDTALLAIVAKLKPLIFVPSQVVVKHRQPLKAIYFIHRGFANTLVNLGSTPATDGKQEAVTGVLGPLGHFGLESFVQRGKVKLSAIAVRTVTYCDMMGLTITDLTAIIAANNLEWAQQRQAVRAEQATKRNMAQLMLNSRFLRRLKAGHQRRGGAGGGAVERTSQGDGSVPSGTSWLLAALRGKKRLMALRSSGDNKCGEHNDAHSTESNVGHGGNEPLAQCRKESLAGKRCHYAMASAQQQIALRRAEARNEDGSHVDGFYGTVAAMVAQERLSSIRAAQAEEEQEAHRHRARSLVPDPLLHALAERSGRGLSPTSPTTSRPGKAVGWADSVIDPLSHTIVDVVSEGERTRGASRSRARATEGQERLRQRQQARAAARLARSGTGAMGGRASSTAQRRSHTSLQFV